MIVAEIVWTLESFCGLGQEDIRDKVIAILNTPGLKVHEESLLLDAIEWHSDKNVDFGDAYNTAWMRDRGLSTALTFDRRHFARFDGIAPKAP